MAESKVTAETYKDTCGKDVWEKFVQLRALCHGDTDRELHLLGKLYIAKHRLAAGKRFKQEYENEYAMTHGKFILYCYGKNKKWPTGVEVTDVNQFGDNQSDDDDDY
jgi:hypothetical protein